MYVASIDIWMRNYLNYLHDTKELNEFINRTNSLSRKLTDTYKAIVRYTNGWPHGNTVYSQEIQPRLSFIVTNVGLLIERDIR